MTGMSDYLENKLVDFVMRAQAFTAPTTSYVALFTVTPADSGGGTEVSGTTASTNYARASLSNASGSWNNTQGNATTAVSSGTTGTITNVAAINFATPGVNGWGTVVAVGVFDALTSGNLLWWGSLTSNKTIAQNDVVDFPAGSLSIQIDN